MYVGIDVGTSMVKAAAFDSDGRELAVEARPVGLALHGGVVEQDMEEVYAAVVGVLEALTARVPGPVELGGLTGQGDGVWLVDKEGRPVRPAASWMDGRAHELLDQWLADGTFETVFRRTGSAMFPGCPGPLLAWFDRYEPKSLDAAATALYCKDMVFRRLTGAPVTTDVSDASMPFLDPRTRMYDNRVVELLGLTHRRGLLAPVGDPIATAAHFGDAVGRLDRPDQHGARIAADEIEAPVDAVGAIDVDARRSGEHGAVAWCRATIGVRRGIIGMVGLDLDDNAADAINQQRGPDQIGRHFVHAAVKKRAFQRLAEARGACFGRLRILSHFEVGISGNGHERSQ